MNMPFGRFEGQPLEDLPDDYLGWLLALPDLREPLRSALEHEWAVRLGVDAAPEAEPLEAEVAAMAEDVVTAGYRVLAKRHHPDAGGDAAAMATLNDAVAALRRQLRQASGVPVS